MSGATRSMGIVIVTGGSRGIGAAVARMAASRGHDVVINYHSRADAAEAVAADVRNAKRRALAVQGDMGSEPDVVRLFATVDRELGPLDALVNNAGIVSAYGRVDALDGAALAAGLAVNVAGYFLCAREAVRRMSTRHGGRGGAIVNVSSRAATVGMPNEYVHYAASKGQRRQPRPDRHRHPAAGARSAGGADRADRPRRPPRGGCRSGSLAALAGGVLRHRRQPRSHRRPLTLPAL